jgi:hypothetical protein
VCAHVQLEWKMSRWPQERDSIGNHFARTMCPRQDVEGGEAAQWVKALCLPTRVKPKKTSRRPQERRSSDNTCEAQHCEAHHVRWVASIRVVVIRRIPRPQPLMVHGGDQAHPGCSDGDVELSHDVALGSWRKMLRI